MAAGELSAAPRSSQQVERTQKIPSPAVQVFPLSDVKAYMGHADIATTMVCVHHVPQHDAADKLSRALRVAAGPDPAEVA